MKVPYAFLITGKYESNEVWIKFFFVLNPDLFDTYLRNSLARDKIPL